MVGVFDPHSSYMSPQDFSLFESATSRRASSGGVGIEVDARTDVITVIAPIEGSPAERAGIRSGDKVLAVNGQAALGVGLEKMVRKMRGKPGTHVKLTLKRDTVKELITVDLVREIIRVPSVASRMLKGDIANVRIKQFQDRTHEELLKAVGRLRGESGGRIAGMVLDMRNNPGGLVDEAAAVADEFLASGTIYTARHRGQVVDEVTAHAGGALVDLPTVVLVNAYTASAAELVTGALQDAKRAKVIGSPTFGKGSVQTIFELPGGAGMRLTTERYYTPAWATPCRRDGIHPDVQVNAEDSVVPLVRERDLEGHLAEETASSAAPAAVIIVDAGTADERAKRAREQEEEDAQLTGGSVARVPIDPGDRRRRRPADGLPSASCAGG